MKIIPEVTENRALQLSVLDDVYSESAPQHDLKKCKVLDQCHDERETLVQKMTVDIELVNSYPPLLVQN
jgi:hypothetical protein